MKQPVITLEYIKRYPNSATSVKWRKKRVVIFAPGRGWWRPQGEGYTMVLAEAWAVPFETALGHTAHISPKSIQIEYHLCDMPGNNL